VQDPTVCLVDGGISGRDVGSGVMVLGADLDQDDDIDDFVYVVGVADDPLTSVQYGYAPAPPTTHTFDPTSASPLNMFRRETIDSTDGTDKQNFADRRAAELGVARRNITCEVDDEDITRWVIPGDYVHAYGPESDLIDPANAVLAGGVQLSPLKVRCVGYTWAIRKAMGLAIIPADGVGRPIVMRPDWVKWADTPTSLDLDSLPRTASWFTPPK
jgi:hypothetical protein